MMKLEAIKKNAAIAGIEPGHVVRIVTTEPVGPDAVTVYYKTSDGRLQERMLFRADEANLSLAEEGRPWAFDAPSLSGILCARHSMSRRSVYAEQEDDEGGAGRGGGYAVDTQGSG